MWDLVHANLLRQRFFQINWLVVLLALALSGFGLIMLYSASGGRFWPLVGTTALRSAIGFLLMLAIALVSLRFWYRCAWPLYIWALVLLLWVAVAGVSHQGAQRWLTFGGYQIQPSEFCKLSLLLVLAQLFHSFEDNLNRHLYFLFAVAVALLPVVFVARQPDLGTAIILLGLAAAIFFCAGISWKKIALAAATTTFLLPILWLRLHDYQRQRIMTFLGFEPDQRGAGYHILQSKIALGSGGIFGKGYMGGTQSHLDFLPEKHTDFIFTMIAEEFGLVGAVILLAFYAALIALGIIIALRCCSSFGRLLAFGVSANLFLGLWTNVAMVTGIIPVVGIPLPLISYGGSANLALLLSLGLLLSVDLDRNLVLSRRGFAFG